MTTTINDLDPKTRLTIIKHLASGKTLEFVATALKLERSTVLDVGNVHGYPDQAKLAWARNVLAAKIDEAETSRIPAATPDTARAAAQPPRSTTTATRTRPTAPAPQQPPTARPEEIRVLLNTAKTSDRKRTQALADRILDQIGRLRDIVDAEREEREARQRADREREEAQAEVARLEAQLAKARAKAGKTRARKTVSGPRADLACRAPATDGDEKCTRTFDSPQGRSLHERRQHNHHHNQGSETTSS